MRLKQWTIPAFCFVALSVSASVSLAGHWRTCNGNPVLWGHGPEIHRNRCSIPDTGDVNTAYWNGINRWNDIISEVAGVFVRPASDCSISFGDGMNEVGLANRSVLDGANGVATYQIGACFLSNDIDEVDIQVANDLPFNAQPGNFMFDPTSGRTSGRRTFVHEFGHFFGFLHENRHSAMLTHSPGPLAGGAENGAVFPSDVQGMNSTYGTVFNTPNLIPSAQQVATGETTSLINTGTFAACRGMPFTVTFYLGNAGVNPTGTYNLRLRLATSATTTGGTVAATFTHSLGGFGEGYFQLPFTVPNVVNGTYFIHVDMDHTSTLAEHREGDNSTVSGMQIQVGC